MAAYAAACRGAEVVLIEKNEKLGKKIYITGKGRCNFTNDVEPAEFLTNVVRGEKFLRGAIYSFSPQKVMALMEEYGLSIKTERGNRVFPASDHASDVTKTLEKACKSMGVQILLSEKVTKILCSMSDICIMSNIVMSDKINMPRIVAVETDKNTYTCDYAIVATGGVSYPTTGSTGDGYAFAKAVGHFTDDARIA
jgi:predicted Rossmann fold flavoprotein